MPRKSYDWHAGVELKPHTAQKHKILNEYVRDYLRIRCAGNFPLKFRMLFYDAFAGGGHYNGEPGSPLVFVKSLSETIDNINSQRVSDGRKPIEFECTIILNDRDENAVHSLKTCVPDAIEFAESHIPQLKFDLHITQEEFNNSYLSTIALIQKGKFKNVLANLDQCGHSIVRHHHISAILNSANSVEIFFTFMLEAFLTYLSIGDKDKLQRSLDPFSFSYEQLVVDASVLSNGQILGAIERLIFESYSDLAPYVSPFAINNRSGWRYWLMHFAKQPRARQAYNAVLHENASFQAHFGRSGIDMLAYEPTNGGQLHLFGPEDRIQSRVELMDDIPKFLESHNGEIVMIDFCREVYKSTPAHDDDIRNTIVKHPDIEVKTKKGGSRRAPNTISNDDVLKLKEQPVFGFLKVLPE